MADPRGADRRHRHHHPALGRGLYERRRTMSGNSQKSMRTPLGRVRNHGSGHSGTSDHWRQRTSAVAMLLLLVPIVFIVMSLLGRKQAGAAQILGSPLVAIILLL